MAKSALSMTPELVNFVKGGDYGDLSTKALTKGAVYGLSSLVAYGAEKLGEGYRNLGKD